MRITTEKELLRVVVLRTRLDAAFTRDFKSAIDLAWTPEIALIDVDLTAVEFMDSSGVGALISLVRRLTPVAGKVRLRGVRPSIRGNLALLRLTPYFEITPP